MSTDEIFLVGIRYVSAVVAAQESNLTRDYIARLCREGKIHGKQIGKNWYIKYSSLQSFLLEHQHALEKQRAELASKRANEYRLRTGNTRSAFQSPPAFSKQIPVPNAQVLETGERHTRPIPVEKSPLNARERMTDVLVKSANVPGLGDAALRLASHSA